LQADYGVYDSLLNVGFGGIFGGALHPAAGGVGDLLARRAGIGAWAENVRTDGSLDLPDLPATFVPGGGTRWIDGDDYARGQFAVVEAERIDSAAQGFDELDPAQVGQSPYAGAGAPVLRPDGGVVDGSRRVATLRQAYTAGQGEAYRSGLIADAAKYGLSPEDVAAMAQPVLVRVEGARETGAAAALRAEAPPQRLTPTQAAEFVDRTVEELRGRATDGLLDEGGAKALHAEDAELAGLLADHYRLKKEGVIPANGLRDGEVAFAEKRRIEIRAALEKHRAATGFGNELRKVLGKLDKLPDSDAALVEMVERMRANALTPDQAATAMRLGITQAVNGADVDVAPVRHLDGSPEGVERVLADKARTEADADARLAAEAEATAKAIAAGVDVTDAAKLDADVKALEQDIRAQLEATGEDLAAFYAAMAQMDELATDLSTEAKALQGAAMCMQRGG
jgi:hypothetical protein